MLCEDSEVASLDLKTLEEEVSPAGENADDETVPSGWRTRKLVKAGQTLIISPSGREFSSRLAGLRFLLESGASSTEVEDMRQFLYYEHWQYYQGLPPGWRLMLVGGDGGVRLLTDQAILLDSFTEAFSQVRERPGEYDEDCVARLTSLQLSLSDTKQDTKAETDHTVPPGWRYSTLGRIDYITAPDGTVFRSRRSALENMMISPGKYGREEVEAMRTFLKYEGWTESSDLPAGWMIKRRKNHIFLMANDGKLFKSFTKAADFVNRHSHYYSPADVQKINKLSSSSPDKKTKRRGKVAKINDQKSSSSNGKTSQDKKRKTQIFKQRKRTPDDSWSSDSTVPEGWLQRTVNMGRNKSFQWLQSPSGQRFKGKRAALQFLMKNQYPAEDIREMRNLLKTDGWQNHPDLPTNWLYKVRGARTVFCSPDGKALGSREKALQFIKANNGTVSDIELLKSFMLKTGQSEEKTKKQFIPDDSWSFDDTIPEGWLQRRVKLGEKKSFQLLLSPDGQKFNGKRSVLAHMIKKGYPQEKISEVRRLLKTDGWQNHPDLPTNWLYKVRGAKTVFCSPDGKALRSREKALQCIKSNNGTASDIELLKSFLIGSGRSEEKPKKQFIPDDSWSSDDSIPEGWLQRRVELREKRSFQLLLSPDGQKFKGKRSVLAHMIKKGYPPEKISEVRRLLEDDGWQSHQDLPENWKFKFRGRQLLFLSPAGKMLGREKSLEFIKSHGSNSEYEKMKTFKVTEKCGVETKPSSPPQKTKSSEIKPAKRWRKKNKSKMIWSEDETLPRGWSSSQGKTYQIKDREGRNFQFGRRQALKHLIVTNGSEEDISVLRESMKSEGWKDLGDKLPNLWLFKTVERQLQFVTERGNLIISKTGARKYLQENSSDLEGDLKKIEDLKYHAGGDGTIIRGKSRVADANWSSEPTNPQGWLQKRFSRGNDRTGQFFLSPDGQIFNGKRSVLKHMIRRNFPQEKITAMRYLLKYDGWAFHQGLPDNWMYKFSGNRLVFCSPDGHLLSSREKVLESIKSGGGDKAEEDVEKVKCFNVSRGTGAKQNKSRGKKVGREDNSVSEHSLDESTEKSFIEDYDENDYQLYDDSD